MQQREGWHNKHRSNLSLTSRQREVMELVLEGMTNNIIATKLCISTGTVHKHLQAVYQRLGALNRAHAAHLFEEVR